MTKTEKIANAFADKHKLDPKFTQEQARAMYAALEFTLALLDNLTTTQFSLGGDRPARERMREALAKADA